MEVRIAQSALSDMLAIACKVIPKNNIVPIYGGVLLNANDDGLSLTATDSVRSVLCMRPADVKEPGEVILPGMLLHDTVKQMPDEVVRLLTKGNDCEVSCGRVRLRPVQFEPWNASLLRFPQGVQRESEVTIPSDIFTFMIDRSCRCVAKEQLRPELCGVHIVSGDGILRMQATDSYRVIEVSTKSDLGEFEAIVSTDCLSDAASLARGESVTVSVGSGMAFVSSESMVHAGRVIAGTYPNLNALIKFGSRAKVSLDSSEFARSLKRVKNVAVDSGKVRLSVEGDVLTILAMSPASGEVRDEVYVDADGDGFMAWFSYKYLSEGVSAMCGETLLTTDGLSSPLVLESHDGCDVRYMLIPMRG